MASIDDLKSRIDLHDLADKLGIKRGAGSNANYHSPLRKDDKPSISIFKSGSAWKDHATGEGGSCIDLVMMAEGIEDAGEAIKRLHELYNLPLDRKVGAGGTAIEAREKSLAEHIADKCLANGKAALEWLVEERKITADVAERAILRKAVGWNDWTSTKVEAGQHGHGGPACAFIVRTLNPGHVVAVDLRYVDPALNGGTKTQCQGEKHGYGWTSDIKRLHAAETVYIVESPVNALSVESAVRRPGVAAYAIRGVGNVDNVDLTWARGKQIFIALDHTDKPFPELTEQGKRHPQAGIRPGLAAAWRLHERLTALDIAAIFVDMDTWAPGEDINDVLQAHGEHELKVRLARPEPWLIPGMAGTSQVTDGAKVFSKRRIYLPFHHDLRYWRYRVRPDFTSYVTKVEQNAEGDNVSPQMDIEDLAGFRVAGLSRVTIASATATMTGDEDSQPKTLFAISVQTTRHGAHLVRKVVEDEKLHNIDTWKKFGPVFNQARFLRMVNILENAAHIGARHAANFVGLCFKEGQLTVNEGPDCYFTNPDQQCPYHNLTFPSGSVEDARAVIEAYHQTFANNAALLALIWSLGGHLKALLGFWPHMEMQADKGAGKSTLIKRLERTIAFTMFSGQSLQTEFRLLTSISHTSHPVGWEEISARRQDILDKAVALLQENYQYTVNRRGSDMTEFLLTAPVLLAGEDVKARSLTGKLVRTKLGAKGPIMREDLPRFPVRQWLEFLAGFTPSKVRDMYETLKMRAIEGSRATGSDDGALRMAGNYAGLLLAWRLLAEFAGLDVSYGGVIEDLRAQMNAHIKETSTDREPWVWIMETLLAEIARHKFEAPHAWDTVADPETGKSEMCLLVRTSDVMHHLATTQALRDIWNGLPVKSDRALKRQMQHAGVTLGEGHERTLGGGAVRRRVSHMTALSLDRLERFGLHSTPTNEFVPA